MLKVSPYEILDLKDNFTYRDIKKAYREKLRQYPPEQYPQEFMAISDAYQTLTNEEYFANNIKGSTLYFDIKADTIKEEKKDLTPFLKKIFEVPFND